MTRQKSITHIICATVRLAAGYPGIRIGITAGETAEKDPTKSTTVYHQRMFSIVFHSSG
jgi:hypothetical protein